LRKYLREKAKRQKDIRKRRRIKINPGIQERQKDNLRKILSEQ
jgi:hypothetical protein